MGLKNDNRGVTFIEVVVVVAILTILATSTASALSFMIRGNVKDAAKNTYSAIASNQTHAKAKSGTWVLTCAYNGTQYELKSMCSELAEPYAVTVLSNRVTAVRVKDSADADYTDLMTLQFEKNTGAVAAINGNPVPNAGYADIQVAVENNLAQLRLYYLTGEIEMY